MDWILPDGSGGGRVGKNTFRARGALPGQRIRPTAHRAKGRTLEVQAFEVVEASPHEREHPCPVQRQCGGCDLGHLDTTVRQEQLVSGVRRALRHETVEFVASPRATRHRSRIKLSLTPEGIGYLAPRSHELVPIEDCLAAREEVAARIPEIADSGLHQGTVEIRSDGERAVLNFEGIRSVGDLPDAAVKGRAVNGDPTLTLNVAGFALRASPRSFFQVNTEGNGLLVDDVVEAVHDALPERVLDLYAGIGNLTIPIAARGVGVTAVELEGQATRDLKFNAAQHGVDVQVHTARVERYDPASDPFDVVVLDPPRSGCSGVLEGVLMLRPRRIVLVSCNIVAGARDLGPAIRAGYTIQRVVAYDLFPDTHHLEVLVVLDRP